MSAAKIPKSELPLASDAELGALVQAFEACTLPYANWTHRTHLGLAVCYSRQYDFATALDRIRKAIKRYNCKCGDPSGYNETVTVMFLRRIFARQAAQPDTRAMHEEVASLAQLCTVDWLYGYYSRERIWSEAAKRRWLEPDIKALDFA